MKMLLTKTALAALLLVPALAGVAAAQATIEDYDFLPTALDPAGNWSSPGNWARQSDGANFVPEGQFNERAIITSGGTAFVDAPIANGPGGLFVSDISTLEIRNGGSLNFAEASTNLADQSARIDGTLSIAGSGQLGLKSIVFMPGASYNVELTVATASPLNASATADINGNLSIDFSGLANPLGTYTIVDASTITGGFSTISATGLGANQALDVDVVGGGTNGNLMTVTAFDQLTLTVNRATGDVSITNPHASPFDLDGYSVTSAAGSMNLAGFSGLGAGWTNGGNNSNSQVAQGFEGGSIANPFDTVAVGSTSIGSSLFQRVTPTSFQQDVEDLIFTFTNGDGVFPGKVEYVGGPKPIDNDIVLYIDDTGDAALLNVSDFPQEVEAYRIASADGVLSNTGWTSLADSGADDGTWAESPLSGTSQLLEVQEGADPGSSAPGANTTTFNKFTLFELGNIYTGGVTERAGITFEFLLAGDSTLTSGSVVFGDIPDVVTIAGDFESDGDVDGADFLKWQRDGLSSAELIDWQTNYGASGTISAIAAVPEPGSSALLLSAAIASKLRRRKVRKVAT